MIRVTCPSCSRSIKCDDTWGGRSAKCPGCKSPVNIPMVMVAVPPPQVPAPTAPVAPVRMATDSIRLPIWIIAAMVTIGVVAGAYFVGYWRATGSRVAEELQARIKLVETETAAKVARIKADNNEKAKELRPLLIVAEDAVCIAMADSRNFVFPELLDDPEAYTFEKVNGVDRLRIEGTVQCQGPTGETAQHSWHVYINSPEQRRKVYAIHVDGKQLFGR
jgi:hypothetical protein